jgi:hypothetical protein
VVDLYLDIVPVGFGSESYFLYDVGMMMSFFATFALFSFLLIKVFAEIHNSADGRVTGGRNLNKVEACLLCHIEGLISIHYPHLIV